MGLHQMPIWLVLSTDCSALLLSLPLALLALPITITVFHYLLDDPILRSNITAIISLANNIQSASCTWSIYVHQAHVTFYVINFSSFRISRTFMLILSP